MIKKVLLFNLLIMVFLFVQLDVYAKKTLLLPIKTSLGLSNSDNLINQKGISQLIISHLSLYGVDILSYKQSKIIGDMLIKKKIRYSNLKNYARYIISGELIKYLEYYELNLAVYDFSKEKVIFEKHNKLFVPNIKEDNPLFHLQKDRLVLLLKSINANKLNKKKYYLLKSYIKKLSQPNRLSAKLNKNIVIYLRSLLRSNIKKNSKNKITAYINSSKNLLMTNSDVLNLSNPLIDMLIPSIKIKTRSKSWKRQVDIMFVIDFTKSLYDEVKYLKKSLRDILNNIHNIRPDIKLRIGITTYKELYSKHKIKMLPLTGDIKVVENYLDFILKQGSEVQTNGIRYGLFYTLSNANWLPYKDQLKMVFVLTDKTIKENLEQSIKSTISKYSFTESIKLANSKNIKVYTIGCSGIDKNSQTALTRISRLTKGDYFNLEYYFSAYLLTFQKVNFIYKDKELFKPIGDISSLQYPELITKNTISKFENISLGDMVYKAEDTKNYLLKEKYPIKESSFNREKVNNNLINIVIKKIKDNIPPSPPYQHFTFVSENYYLPVKISGLTKEDLKLLKSWSKNNKDVYIAVNVVPTALSQTNYLENNHFTTKTISFNINPYIIKIFSPDKTSMIPNFLVKKISDINKTPYEYTKKGVSKKKYWFLKGKMLLFTK